MSFLIGRGVAGRKDSVRFFFAFSLNGVVLVVSCFLVADLGGDWGAPFIMK